MRLDDWISVALALLWVGPTPARVTNGYSSRMFADAVADRGSSSRPFVLVTIVDGRQRRERTGCVSVGSLASALAMERGWKPTHRFPGYQDVDRLLLTAHGRRFTFQTTRWLTGAGYDSMAANEAACALLRRGVPAYRVDLTGETVAGRP